MTITTWVIIALCWVGIVIVLIDLIIRAAYIKEYRRYNKNAKHLKFLLQNKWVDPAKIAQDEAYKALNLKDLR